MPISSLVYNKVGNAPSSFYTNLGLSLFLRFSFLALRQGKEYERDKKLNPLN